MWAASSVQWSPKTASVPLSESTLPAKQNLPRSTLLHKPLPTAGCDESDDWNNSQPVDGDDTAFMCLVDYHNELVDGLPVYAAGGFPSNLKPLYRPG